MSTLNVIYLNHLDLTWRRPRYHSGNADGFLLTPYSELQERQVDAGLDFIRGGGNYDIEQTITLREYLERNPDAKEEISDMIAEEDNGLGSIVYNVSVEPTGANNIPIVVQKEGCKSITEYIVLTRPVMTVPIELDAATPSSASSDSIKISGKVEPGVRVKVTSPISGDLHVAGDGEFNFTAKLEHFGDNDIVIKADKDGEESVLVHTVTYNPTFNDYVAKAWAMDYEALDNYAGDYKPFKCTGEVVEVFQQEPYTCIFNVGSDSNPKHIYLEMVPGKPLSTDMEYIVYADTHAEGTKDGYPYMIGRFFLVKD